MASPTATRSSGLNFGTAATSFALNTGSPAAGLLLVFGLRFPSDPGTITFTGYTPLVAGDTSDASDDTTAIYYRWTDGTEGVSDTMSTTNSVKLAAIRWTVTGAENPATQPPEVSAVAVGTTVANTANPNVVTPTGGSKDYLFIALMAADGEGNSPTVAPSGYTSLGSSNTGTTGAVGTNAIIGGAHQGLTASSEDPGAFTHPAAANGWTAFTVAVHPPGAGGNTYTKTGFGKEAG